MCPQDAETRMSTGRRDFYVHRTQRPAVCPQDAETFMSTGQTCMSTGRREPYVHPTQRPVCPRQLRCTDFYEFLNV